MLKHRVTHGPASRRRPRPLRERVGNRLCLSTRSERFIKRYLILATLVGVVTTAVDPCAYADLFIGSRGGHNSVLRYDERTGDYLGEFVLSGSGGLSTPGGLI